MKTKWKDYLELITYDKVEDYYLEKFDGDKQKASIAMVLSFTDKKDSVLLNNYNIYDSIDEMVFGQFIACEKVISSGNDKNIILEILSYNIFRPVNDIMFDNTDRQKEEIHVESIREEDSFVLIQIINKWLDHRNYYVNKKYNGVFYKIIDDEDVEDEEELTGDELSAEEQFSRNWYWYAMVRSLASENVLKIEEVLMKPMADIAPELAYRRQKDVIDTARRKREEQLRR